MHLKFLATVTVLVLVMSTPHSVNGKAWKGLVPLQSTRADVEKVLGPETVEDLGYDLDGERVLISYSAQGCQEGLPGGWKVPADTLVSISVSAKKEIKLTDVLVPGKNYEQIYRVHSPQLVDYVDVQEGVRYTAVDGSVQTTTYFGAEADDKRLRCGEYKYAAGVTAGARNKFEQVPYDSFGKLPFADSEGRLDNFNIQLAQLNEGKSRYRGFIIVYAGRSAYNTEASTMAGCSKNYLVSVRNADPDTLVAADGGYRDEFLVELYIIPDDAYPPLLMPTVSPKKVEILPGTFTPCSK